MVDDKQVVYSKESLVDIVTDKTTSKLGTVTISGGQITLGPQSSVSYEYTYEAGKDSSIITDILQLDCSIIGLTDGMNTRYNRYLSILIKVQYYLEIAEGNNKTYYDGNIDTFEIYPYLSHESNNTLYNIALQNSYIKKITITYKNNYSNDSVKYTNIKLKYSMSLLEAIDKYGGESTFVPGSDSLKFYSVNDKYSIDSYGDSLIMKMDIDSSNWDEVVKPYIKPEYTTETAFIDYYNDADENIPLEFEVDNPVTKYTANIRWTVRSRNDISGSFSINIYGNEQVVSEEYHSRTLTSKERDMLGRAVNPDFYLREYNRIMQSGGVYEKGTVVVNNRYCKIIGYKTDTLIVRVEYIDASNIYFEREVKINNCSIVDFKLTFDDNDMEIHGSDIQLGTLEVIPSNIKQVVSNSYAAKLSCISYDEMGGKVRIVGDDGNEHDSLSYFTLPARIKVKGSNNGKILFTATSIGLYPEGFSKSWIAEVFDVEGIKIWIEGPNKITSVNEIYNYTIKNSQGLNMTIPPNTSNWTYKSIEGGSIKYTNMQSGDRQPELGFSIRANTNGKVILQIILEIVNTSIKYTITKEVEIAMTDIDTPKLNVYSSTNSWVIDKPSGQIVLDVKPNYSEYGKISIEQTSLDGGSVGLSETYDTGVPCTITAKKEGKVLLTVKPTLGPSETVEVEVQNQYTQDVELKTPDNVDMIAAGGQLTVNGIPGRPYNPNYYKFNWVFDKINPEVDFSNNNGDYYTTITGKGLGLIRLNCYNYFTGEFLASRIFKVVQSIGSINIELPYPDTKPNWVLFRRRDQNNKLFLGTLNGAVTKCIYSGTSIEYDVTMTQYSQYYINTDGKTWKNHGNWTNSKNMTSQATELIASSINVYDSDDMFILPASEYKTVNFADIIYGVGHIGIKLKTSKDTVFINDIFKIEALNSNDTVDYDWKFDGTNVMILNITNKYIIIKPTTLGVLRVYYKLLESGNIVAYTDIKVIEKPTNLKYIRLYITKAYRNGNEVGYCNMSEFDVLDSNGNSVLTDNCIYTADSKSGSDVPAKAFDKNTRTIWHSADNSKAHWIQIEFASNINLPSSYVVTRRTDGWNDYIASWELQVSTDGSTWITLDKHTNDTDWSNGYSRTFNL